ncbi:acetyl-CoA carboxylase biotin carboxyl carrier protein subunit [Phyllobacterium brassicacearum]|uniref:Biotin carboxyl carrier protein of acetyl-CoA carboxylase n=1 Tax=Phyllobacterium brassicacearum TaxID=314235 RepID=A0A2P7BAC9_9HYPH|nr:acetyl-CoA carboxylase biotin carboxyl carrier protein subunit [Phyllobacterium brassicacearum]PSH63408.1 acetyl-CoA carboxylase biotin carboxyl carrier protein subunit [Phyllobacterium brassicacearum]TDQ18011.1 acetyl-CoA carboxylase biotin carboxyl carrier protein [Phyllobacterium brassicacearum]
MDLSKIKTLIDFVGHSNITELTVTEKDTTVRIFRTHASSHGASSTHAPPTTSTSTEILPPDTVSIPVHAPIFGVLHAAPAPGENAFIRLGDTVEAGQTLFIIEAMKVFNNIVAPRAGRILHITGIDGSEVETGDILAEIV